MSSDDIIEKLQKAKSINFGHYSAPSLNSILDEAINEIKRLQANLFMAEKWRDNYEIGLNDYKKLAEHWYNEAKGNDKD